MNLSATGSAGKRAVNILAAREALKRAKVVLLDWDGCVAFENRPAPDAMRLIAEWRDRVAIVSNNSTNYPEEFAQILARAGMEVPAHRIILAGVEAIKRTLELNAERVLFLGDNRMKAFGRNCGLNLVRDEAGLVLLLRDTRISYARLERAVNCLRRGAKLVVSNPDTTHPGRHGRLVPETGAILAALRACVAGREFELEMIGKPGDRLFARACQILGARPDEAVMIGDSPSTDAAGAGALGIPHILIGGTGVEFADLLQIENAKTARSLALVPPAENHPKNA